MWRTHNSSLPTQGQGHSWRWAFHFVSAPYLLYPWTDFQLTLLKCFATVRRCAEPITQPCRLKKVVIKGHGIVPCILCPLHVSFTHRRIFIKLRLKEMCRTHNSTMPTSRSRSQLKVTSLNLALNFGSAQYLYPWKNLFTFGKLFAS